MTIYDIPEVATTIIGVIAAKDMAVALIAAEAVCHPHGEQVKAPWAVMVPFVPLRHGPEPSRLAPGLQLTEPTVSMAIIVIASFRAG